MPKSMLLEPSKYFEAIIQLRPYDDKVFDYIENAIHKRKGVFISRIDELKTGIDIYVSSQKFARALGAKLKRQFKGELKVTKKLHTEDRLTSKKLYRATVLFRLKKD